MLVVAWSDGAVDDAERETIEERAKELPEHLQGWLRERIRHPPGPYFRYQVAHLLAFLATVWPSDAEWAEEGAQWASELIQEAGWIRRLFRRVDREKQHLDELRRLMDEEEVLATDRIWAMARGVHAAYEPRHHAAVDVEEGQLIQALAISLDGSSEKVAVATKRVIVRNEDLDQEMVATLLAHTAHAREHERWVMLAEQVNARGRAPTVHQQATLDAALTEALGFAPEAISYAELSYLEDALATDARWASWLPGQIEELRIDRDQIIRTQAPGTFQSPRASAHASVAQQPVPGPPGLGFRVLSIQGEGPNGPCELRLASPVILREPATPEAVQWIARFLPAMCDPCTTLMLDLEGPQWIAEVHPRLPNAPASHPEPLLPGRALLVPPWVWFRAAWAMGVRFFSGKRRTTSTV